MIKRTIVLLVNGGAVQRQTRSQPNSMNNYGESGNYYAEGVR